MKQQINSNGNACQLGEVALFRLMKNELNKCGHRCIFCEETHQHYVKFRDAGGKLVRCEISDLLFVCLDAKTRKVRISFLQAKRKRGNLSPYTFRGDFKQFYLLSQRPCILSGFPCDTLKFSPSESLTSYGVLYNDPQGCVDLFYAAANRLMTKSRSRKAGNLVFDTSVHGQPPVTCTYVYCGVKYDECIAADGIDLFEKFLITWKIGAVLPKCCKNKVLSFVFKHVFRTLSRNIGTEQKNDEYDPIKTLIDLAREYDIQFSEGEIDGDGGLFPTIMIIESNSGDDPAQSKDTSPQNDNSFSLCRLGRKLLNGEGGWMLYTMAESQLGKWNEHRHEFLLSRIVVDGQVRGSVILKLFQRSERVGIGYYVYQNRRRIRAHLRQELGGWLPPGLEIQFNAERDVGEDAGFVLYAYIESVTLSQLKDCSEELDQKLGIVKSCIREISRRLAKILPAHGVWEHE